MRTLAPSITIVMCLSILAPGAVAQTDTSIENLRAFATLYGHVRYFHPSDEAASVDWEAFAIHGVERVRGATDPSELRRALEELFVPIAPTLRFGWLGETPPSVPTELRPSDTERLDVVAWQHQGVGFGRANSLYRSARTNRQSALTYENPKGALLQSVDPADLRGKAIRLTGIGRAITVGARLYLWLRVDRPAGVGFFDGMIDRPVTADTWTEIEIRGMVDADAEAVVLGVRVEGGAAAVDDLRLEVEDDAGWRPVALQNGDFEEPGGDVPPGWRAITESLDFRAELGEAPAGDRYLAVSPRTITISGTLFEGHARPGEMAIVPLARGIVAYVPLALWSQAGKTLGAPSIRATELLQEGLDSTQVPARTAVDEALRLAGVIIAWNVFEHFYPYWDVVNTDWDAVLTGSLERALSDGGGTDFLRTLQWMVAGLKDGHGYVDGPGGPALAGLPIRFRWIEDRVVVVASDSDAFRPGDVIWSLDGRPAEKIVTEEIARQSGTLQWRRWKAMNLFGRGEPGTEATIELEREGGLRHVAAIRADNQPAQEIRPTPVAELHPGIFYVDLSRANLRMVNERVDTLAAANGVIFDLRGYPSGNEKVLAYLSDKPLRSSHWRIPEITRPDWREDPTYKAVGWNLAPQQPRFRGRIVFLTDERAISYAESILGIVEHYGLGEIVGQPTAGANGNVNRFTLPGGYHIGWTGMRVVKHDETPHHLVGIQPTVAVAPTIEGIRAGVDEVLERALEVVQAK